MYFSDSSISQVEESHNRKIINCTELSIALGIASSSNSVSSQSSGNNDNNSSNKKV